MIMFLSLEKAIALIVNGFSKEVLNKLPMEFARLKETFKSKYLKRRNP